MKPYWNNLYFISESVLRYFVGALRRATIFLAMAFASVLCQSASAQNLFTQSNLVSDIPGMAAVTDTNLVNPWGLAFTASSPFWIADNHSGLATIYNSTGAVQALVVFIPAPSGDTNAAAPTGEIANSAPGFLGTGTNTAHFIFSTEDGTIVAWSTSTQAVLKVDFSASGAVFKGLAAGSTGGSNLLYAADFHNGQVDVFATNYAQVTLAGSFTDPSIPAGYAPFGIQNIGGRLFVTYALQDSDKHDDVGGPGHGFVDVYDTAGNLLQNFSVGGTTNSPLNSPWGVTVAPAGFGPFAGDVLIGNFGDGRINAFDPISGVWLGSLNGTDGDPFAEPGLWAVAFGNGHNGGDTGSLYFTAGINGEDDGLFGRLTPVFPSPTSAINCTQSNLVSDIPGMAAVTDTNLVNPWGLAFNANSPFWVADNGSGLATLYNSTGAVQALVVFIPVPPGDTNAAAPTGQIANSAPGFLGTGTNTAHFIFSTEDGTIVAWSGGTQAVLKVDLSASGAVFKGLATGSIGASNLLYTTDFHNGQVDVFDTNYSQVTVSGGFTDTNIPAGFAPFGIQNINGQLFVTYALQDDDKHDDVSGAGNGFVDIFDTSGHLVQRFASQGPLDSPWGITWAPFGFGAYGGHILIGNFGDGRINEFDPTTGAWLGAVLLGTDLMPFEEKGLWAIAFGNGHNGGDAHTLYFTAGINGENDGLFGSIANNTPTFTGIVNDGGTNVTLSWGGGGAGPFLVQQNTDLTTTNWVTITTTTSPTVTVGNTNDSAFFRVINEGH